MPVWSVTMKISEVIAVIFGAMFVSFVVFAVYASERQANTTCEEMIALAQTRSDTLIVYGMKPGSKFETCADRLRKEAVAAELANIYR